IPETTANQEGHDKEEDMTIECPATTTKLPRYGPEVIQLPSPSTVDYLSYYTDMFHDPMMHETFMTLFPSIPNCYQANVIWYRSMVEIRNMIELAMMDRLAGQLTSLTVMMPVQVPRIKMAWMSSLRRLEILGIDFCLLTDSDLDMGQESAFSRIRGSTITRLDRMLMFIWDHQRIHGTLRELRIENKPSVVSEGRQRRLARHLFELVEAMGDNLEVLEVEFWVEAVLYLDRIPTRRLRRLWLHIQKDPAPFFSQGGDLASFLSQCRNLEEIRMYSRNRDMLKVWRPEERMVQQQQYSRTCTNRQSVGVDFGRDTEGRPLLLPHAQEMTKLKRINLAGSTLDMTLICNEAAELFASNLETMTIRSWFDGKIVTTPLSWTGSTLAQLTDLDLEGGVTWTFDYSSLLNCPRLSRLRLAFSGPKPSRSTLKQPAIDVLTRVTTIQDLELVGHWETLQNRGWPRVISGMQRLERLDLLGCERITAEQVYSVVEDIVEQSYGAAILACYPSGYTGPDQDPGHGDIQNQGQETMYRVWMQELFYGHCQLRWVIVNKRLEDGVMRHWDSLRRRIASASSHRTLPPHACQAPLTHIPLSSLYISNSTGQSYNSASLVTTFPSSQRALQPRTPPIPTHPNQEEPRLQMTEQLLQQGAAGVRAEPVFIRDPSALESLSSVITGVSSYVANTLPAPFSMPARGFTSPSSPNFPGNTSSPYYYPAAQGSANPLLGNHQDQVCVLTNGDVVLFSAFDWIESGAVGKNKIQRRFCLLLGYADGFQIWDITHPDNIHEIASVRNAESEVSFIKVLPSPRASGKSDLFEQHRPLMAVVMSNGYFRSSNKSDGSEPYPKKIQIYSLATHQIVKTLDFGEGPDYDISALDVNERGLVVALTSGEGTRLFLINQLTLHPLHQKQTVLNDAAYPGVFDLGTRLLAYVTTTEAPTDSPDSKYGEEQESSGGYQDLAKGVAKEVFGGVKMLGGFAHQTLSTYWSGASGGSSTSTSPPVPSGNSRSPNRHARRASASASGDQDRLSHRRRHDDNSPLKKEAVGTVIIRDISMTSMPVVAHFRPHDHPITGCKFSPSGRLLLTVSRHGNVFHIHEVRPAMGLGSRHVYKLARGITHASVEDITFNEDETWVAVTTSRGTTHLYAINPFGGSPDVGAHMYTGVVNWTATAIEYPTSLNALCRIKQRHHVPDIIVSAGQSTDPSDYQLSATTERRRGSLQRQSSQDSLSSTGAAPSDHSQGYLSRLQQKSTLSSGGRQRAMIATFFLPSTTVFASDPASVALSPGEYEGTADGLFGSVMGDQGRRDGSTSQAPHAHSSSLLINRSKAPPVSTAARLQSTASQLWHTLSPPAAAVVQHAAHGLASLPGLVVETSRRGPVATVRSRTVSWTGSNSSPGPSNQNQPSSRASNGTNGRGMDTQKQNAASKSEVPLAVQQQLASQGSLAEPERAPSFADMYVFNPLGMLTLHRCWISSVRSKKTYNGRVVETSDLVLAPEDVVEWTLNRASDWAQVKRSLAPPAGSKYSQPMANKARKAASGAGHAGSRWLAHAEISTYDNGMHSGWKGQYPLLNQTLAAQGGFNSTITLTQPQHLLWKSPQFSFQTYIGSTASIQQDFSEGRLPAVKTLNLRRGVELVAGNDGRSAANALANRQSATKPWISGIAVSADGKGVRGHGRVDSHEGDTEDLSENLSSAMKSYLQTHSSSPINQSRMSPSGGSISPSSFRATLSFEDAYLINLGHASGSPKPTFLGSMNQPSPYNQHMFISTPPGENGHKARPSSISGASPVGVHPMAAFTNASSAAASPTLVSSLGDSSASTNGSAPTAAVHPLNRQNRNSLGPSPARGSPTMNSLGASGLQPTQMKNPMAQSTLMMFSPDGDNEVDMPGSASVFIGSDAGRRGRSSLSSTGQQSGGDDDEGSTLPHGGVFHLDDDFHESSNGAAGNGLESGKKNINGHYDDPIGRGRSRTNSENMDGELLDHEDAAIEDDYDDFR
ncbi:hypothetical protein BGX28_009345, partial [Mortierella sp. GBA30]